MASQFHRQAVVSSALQALQTIDKDHETTLNSMHAKTTEELTVIDQPPTVYPVVVGGRSFFKSPRDLALFLGEDESYYYSQTVFELTHNTDLKLDIDPDRAFNILLEADLPNLFVCEVDSFTASNLEILPMGTRPLIWFEGKCQAAWLPTCLREINLVPSTCESGASKNIPTNEELLIVIGDLGDDCSVFKTAEDLWNFLDRFVDIVVLPRPIQTTATNVKCDKSCPDKPDVHYHHYPSRLVACVDADQYRKVEDNTTGDRRLVWFPNNVARYAWVPHVMVSDDRSEDNASYEGWSEDSGDKPNDTTTNQEEALANTEVEGAMNDEDHDAANEIEEEEDEATLRLMRLKGEKSERRATEGNWQEAARRAMLPQPPKLFNIVVGQQSLFKTPQDVSSLLGLPNNCSTSTTFELPMDLCFEIYDHPETGADLVASNSETLTSVQIFTVHYSDLEDIKALTKSEKVSIWFDGEIRTAWIPKSFRDVKQHLDGCDFTSKSMITGGCSFPVIVGTRNYPFNMFKDADDLARYFDLSEIPSVVPTVETYIKTDEYWRFGYREPHYIRYAPEFVSFVTRAQRCELEARSYGETVLVWFPDKTCRQAWRARAPRNDEERGDAEVNNDDDVNSNQESVKNMGETVALNCEESTVHKEESPAANMRESSVTANSSNSKDAANDKVDEEDMSESMGCGLCPWIRNTYKRIMRKFRRG